MRNRYSNQLLALFVRLFNLGELCIAPFEVKLSPTGSAREPDIFFIAAENKARLTEERLVGPPGLIIEIVSAGSLRRDRQDKFKEYQAAESLNTGLSTRAPINTEPTFSG